MLRSLRAVPVLAALTLILTACGNGGEVTDDPATDETGTTEEAADDAVDADEGEAAADTDAGADADLVIWTDEARTPTVQAIGDEFAADQGITVSVQQLDFGDIRDDLITQGPAGEGPDVLIGAHDWLGQLVTNGAVAPIELGDATGDYTEVALDAFTYEGQLYGVPYAVENIALFRNTNLAPEAPADWDAMVETGLALTEAGEADLGLALQVGPDGDPYHFYPLFTSFGDAVFGSTEDGSYDPEQLQIDGEGGLAFARLLDDLADKGLLSADVTFDIALEAFVAGRAPYLLTGPWNVNAVEEAGIDFVVEPLPSPGEATPAPFVGVQGFMISAYADNPLLANDFVVNYLGTEEVARELFESGQRPPAMVSVAEEVADDPIIAGFAEVGERGHPLPSIPAMNVVWEDWGAAQRDILLGTDDPEERMRQAGTLIRDAIAEN